MSENGKKTALECVLVYPGDMLETLATATVRAEAAEADTAKWCEDAERLAVALAYCIKALEKLDDFKPYPGCANPFAEVLTMGRAALAAHDATKEKQ